MSTIIAMQDTTLPADCLVFKHSTTCPISAHAAEEVRAMVTALPIYWINVREQRALSDWIVERYGVTHESPQLILVRDGKAERSWDHYGVIRGILGQ